VTLRLSVPPEQIGVLLLAAALMVGAELTVTVTALDVTDGVQVPDTTTS
jgi:hypothetical protein